MSTESKHNLNKYLVSSSNCKLPISINLNCPLTTFLVQQNLSGAAVIWRVSGSDKFLGQLVLRSSKVQVKLLPVNGLSKSADSLPKPLLWAPPNTCQVTALCWEKHWIPYLVHNNNVHNELIVHYLIFNPLPTYTRRYFHLLVCFSNSDRSGKRVRCEQAARGLKFLLKHTHAVHETNLLPPPGSQPAQTGQ